MTNDLTPVETERLAAISSEQLREDLAKSIGITAQSIARVAAIWNELVRRGEDLTDVKFALRDYMRDVAQGRLLPEAVAQLAGRVRTLNAVASLPVEEQRRLLDGAPVPVLVDGTPVDKTLNEMTFTEVTRVFRGGQILGIEEQRLAHRRMVAARRPRTPAILGRPRKITVDREDGIVAIGNVRVRIEDVLSALRSSGIKLENID